jgi:hypothetical protein
VRLGRLGGGWGHDCFVLEGGQSAERGLAPTSVVGPFDPGHDRDPQLFAGALVGAAGGVFGGVAGAVGSRLAGTAAGRVMAGAGGRLASTSVGRGAAVVGRAGNAALAPARSMGTRIGTRIGTSARSLLRTGGNRSSTTTQGAAGTGVAARNYEYGDLTEFDALGITDMRTGAITIQRGLTGREFEETLRHETVHSVLTPKNRVLNTTRSLLYDQTNIWRGVEEAIAETYATRNLARGLAFPIKNGYLSLKNLSGDILLTGAVGGIGYGIYQGRP